MVKDVVNGSTTEVVQGKVRLVNVHPASSCMGHSCVVHAPSDHAMRDWDMVWRPSKMMFERICPHERGHPDPDCADYNIRVGAGYLNIHGCDGCCLTD